MISKFKASLNSTESSKSAYTEISEQNKTKWREVYRLMREEGTHIATTSGAQ